MGLDQAGHRGQVIASAQFREIECPEHRTISQSHTPGLCTSTGLTLEGRGTGFPRPEGHSARLCRKVSEKRRARSEADDQVDGHAGLADFAAAADHAGLLGHEHILDQKLLPVCSSVKLSRCKQRRHERQGLHILLRLCLIARLLAVGLLAVGLLASRRLAVSLVFFLLCVGPQRWVIMRLGIGEPVSITHVRPPFALASIVHAVIGHQAVVVLDDC